MQEALYEAAGYGMAAVLFCLHLLEKASRRVPIDVTKLKKKTARAELDFDGETVAIEYRRHIITPEYAEVVDSVMSGSSDSGARGMCDLVRDLVVSWDLEDGDGNEYPREPAPSLDEKGKPEKGEDGEPKMHDPLMEVPLELLSAVIFKCLNNPAVSKDLKDE